MKKFLFYTLLLLLAGTAGAFDFSKWQKSGLDKAEFKDGVLHLAQTSKSGTAASLNRRFTNPEIKKLIGSKLVFSADIELLNSDRPDAVGLVISGRLKSGKTFSQSCYLPFVGKHSPVQAAVQFIVPQDIYTLYARFEVPRKRSGIAEALFRNIKIGGVPANTEVMNCGTGSFFAVGKEKIFWNWKTTPGLKAELKGNAFELDGKGTLTLCHQPGRPYALNGSTPDFASLTFQVASPGSIAVDITSYGKKNDTVKLDIAVSKNGRINGIKIPLSRFASFHDLERFEEISFTVDGKQTIKNCRIIDLDMAGEAKNILLDPSFEESVEPAPNFIFWGDYRVEKLAKNLRFSTSEKYHGKRSLEIAPDGFITLQASDSNGMSAVFSLYAKGKTKFEVKLQQQLSKIHGATAMHSWKKEFTSTEKWQRFEFVSPLKLEKFSNRQLYVVKVRNLGKEPLYIDAVQLEQNTLKASVFKPERKTAFVTSAKTKLPMDLPAEPQVCGKNKVSGKVKITAVNPDKRNYDSIPVRGGVTFGKGELFDPNGLQVTDLSGKEIPAQFTVLARRVLDKSIISVAVDFNTQLKSGERKDFHLLFSNKTFKRAGKNIAEKRGKDIVINTGKLSLLLTPKEKSFIKGCDAFCAVQSIDGRIHRSAADIVRIDENGPQRATVFMRGKSILAWELRLTFFKDQPYMKVDYSFENNYKTGDVFSRCVKSIFVELPGGERYQCDRFHGAGNALFSQRHARTEEFMWDVYTNINGRKQIIDNLKLSGSGRAGSAAFHIADFAELAPRAIGFSNGKVRFYHYPPEGVALLDMPAGFSSTMQFNYAFNADSVPASGNAFIYVDPVHTGKSQVFDAHLSREYMLKHFPKTAAELETVFDSVLKATAVTAFYGLGDYGDWGTRNYYCNHETAGVRSLFTRYLVTGEVCDFVNACAHAQHQRDIDQVHFQYGVTAVQTHNGYNNHSYSFHTGHFWLTGLIWHYFLTGDRRSYESAVSAMAVLIEKSGLKYPRGRERHRMLYHLAEVYGFTGHDILKKAFERQYNAGGASDGSAYYGAISYEALDKLYEVTGEQHYFDRLVKEMRSFEKANKVDFLPMPENRGERATQGGIADAGRGVMSVYSGSRAAMRFNDAKLINYLDVGTAYDPVLTKLLDPRARYANLSWLYGAFEAMKHFNIKEHVNTPHSYSFIYMFSGVHRLFNNYVPFVLEAVPEKDGYVTLDVYRYRMFRYWNKKLTNDYVYCTVYCSKGKMLKAMTLNGNVTNEHKQLRVKSPDGKTLRVELVFDNDSWGSISSPGKLRLSSARTFGARNSSATPIAMYIKVPKSGKLEIKWTWANKTNIEAGNILSAYLEDLNGKMVVRSAYTIPDDMPQTPLNTHVTKLEIPEAYRGKILKLYLSDPKWFSWQMSGLDYPWLGNKAEDLQ